MMTSIFFSNLVKMDNIIDGEILILKEEEADDK
jgi:hypothetical protein